MAINGNCTLDIGYGSYPKIRMEGLLTWSASPAREMRRGRAALSTGDEFRRPAAAVDHAPIGVRGTRFTSGETRSILPP
jgi:hypothetical protein